MKRREMGWAQRLKRVFGIDVEVCPHCGGGVRIVACIEDPVVIRQILSHVGAKQACNHSRLETSHPVERRRRLGYLDKIEFTDSIAGIGVAFGKSKFSE